MPLREVRNSVPIISIVRTKFGMNCVMLFSSCRSHVMLMILDLASPFDRISSDRITIKVIRIEGACVDFTILYSMV